MTVLFSAEIPAALAKTKAKAKPAPVPVSLVWDTSELYKSAADWDTQAKALEAALPAVAKLEGTLGKDAASMLAALDTISDLRQTASKLYTYAGLVLDEDRRVPASQERRGRIQSLYSKLDANASFVAPELLKIGADKIKAFRKASPELDARFGFMLDDTLRSAPHVLSDDAEKALGALGEIFSQPSNLYDVFADGELPFETITLADGSKVELDQAGYSKVRQSPNRADRKLAFDTFWSTWKKYEATLGANLNASVIMSVSYAKARKYPSALGAALFYDNMPEAVYRTLVAEANHSLPTLHRYLNIRKKLMGLEGNTAEPMAYYDIYPALFQLDAKFDIPTSKEITLKALAPLGPEYIGELKKGFAGKWMHVYPQPGKASGAYMNGSAYDTHPFLLLNHRDDFDSLSTFAHEWGHAVHTLLTTKNQPYEKSNYSTFVAETASITNEMLLQDYMIANAKTKQEKLAYLNEALDTIRSTYFRQTQFAEFQLAIHDEVEKGNALSGARMTEIYCGILRKYHGHDKGVMVIDDKYCTEWAFIPHFYNGFYVYQYATSIAGSALLADQVTKGGKKGQEVFLDMLRAGGSAYAYDIYKKAGIDMASPAPYRALEARMNAIMDQMEALLKS